MKGSYFLTLTWWLTSQPASFMDAGRRHKTIRTAVAVTGILPYSHWLSKFQFSLGLCRWAQTDACSHSETHSDLRNPGDTSGDACSHQETHSDLRNPHFNSDQ